MDYNLGTARGRIVVDPSGAVKGYGAASAAHNSYMGKMRTAQAGMRSAGKGLLAIGAAAGVGLGIAVKAAAGFEKELSNFQSATRVSEAEMEKIRQKALQIGRDTSFGAGEAAGAMVELGKAGQSVDQILQGTADATIALAEAGEVDLVYASETMVKTLSQFRLGADEAMRATNALVGAADASTASVESLAEGMKYAGPGAAALGVSVEDTAAALALFEQNGINGGSAGTMLRSIFTRLNPTTARAKENMEALGLYSEKMGSAFYNSKGKFIGTEQAIGLLSESMSGLTDEQKAARIEAIFGQRAIAGVNSLVTEGAEGYREFNDAVRGADAAETAKIKLDNLAGSFKILKGTVETALIGIGSPLQDVLKTIVDGVTRVINAFAAMPEGVQKAIGIGLIIVAVLGTLGGAFLLLLSIIPAVVAGFATFTGVLLPVLAPIALVVAAIAAIGTALVLLWKNNETFRNNVKAAWEGIKSIAAAVWPIILSAVKAFVDWFRAEALPFIMETWQQIQAIFSAAVDLIVAVVKWFVNIVQKFWEGFGKHILAFGQRTFKNLAQFLKGIWNGIKNIISGVLQVIKGVFNIFAGIFTGDWKRVWEGIKQVFSGIWRAITGIFRAVWSTIRFVVKQGIEIIRTIIGAGMQAISQVFRGIWNAIVTAAKAAWRNIVSWVRGQIAEMKAEFRKLMDLGGLMVQVGRNIIQGLINGIKNMAGAAVQAAKDAVGNAIQGAKNLLRLGSPSKVFIEFGENTMEGFIRGMQAMERSVGSASQAAVGAAVGVGATAAQGGSRGFTPTSTSSTTMTFGDIILPNITDRSTADDLLAGLRQAARKGA